MPPTVIHTFDVTIPAGTAKATPLVTPTTFADNVVERIEWTFPDGCNGLVGIQIGARKVPVLPPQTDQFVVRSGSMQGIDLDGMHTTGDWSVIGYNTGQFDHTVHVQFTLHRPVPETPLPGYLVSDLVDSLHGGG
jgi:hypothetical protein